MNTLEFVSNQQVVSRQTDFSIAFVGFGEAKNSFEFITTSQGKIIRIFYVERSEIMRFLNDLEDVHSLASVFLFSENGEEIRNFAKDLRKESKYYRTRIYIASSSFSSNSFFRSSIDPEDIFDIEQVVSLDSLRNLGSISTARILDNAIAAFQSIQSNPLMPDYYLDTTYDKVFDWFETTRWDWSELNDYSNIDKSLLSNKEIEILKESAIIEFGTLPGAHNFLREWLDDYSFSSWALSWGAEESRHSLVQCRYLREIDINIRAKHAMYKRQPYPLGESQAGTLMMNIISESRAAEYYKNLSKQTQEPVIKKIWKLLGQDEARHARAFFIFSKELCNESEKNIFESLKMAYVWLADREHGVKHPAGHFFPHSSSTDGLRDIEIESNSTTDKADARVFAMCSALAGDKVRNAKDLKSIMRSYL